MNNIRNYYKALKTHDRVHTDTVSNFLFVFGTTVLFFLFSNLLITSLLFFARYHAHIAVPYISAGATMLFTLFLSQIYFSKFFIASLFILASAAAVFFISVKLEQSIYDISYDGQTYQQEGVIQLSNDWNPVYEELDPDAIGPETKWINYYPKAAWVNESYLYRLTGDIRSAKALNIVLIVTAFAFAYAALRDNKLLNSFHAALISLLIALNPVAIYQSLSFYVDGQVLSLFICLGAILFIIYSKKREFALISCFLAMTIFLNLKFTAIVYAGILIFAVLATLWMREEISLSFRMFTVSFASMLVGLLIIGFSPYMTNVIRYGAPLYPIVGKNHIDLKPYNVPGNFLTKNSAQILFLSFFSTAGLEIENGEVTSSVYKLPFTYTDDELKAFRKTDPREGGFGPLFSGSLLFSFLIVGLLYLANRFWIKKKNYDKAIKIAFWLMVLIIITCVANPIASFARYVPQAYLIAVIPIVMLLNLRVKSLCVIACLGIALLALNSGLIAKTYISHNLASSRQIEQILSDLSKKSQKRPILVKINQFKSNRIMLEQANIRYISTPDPKACPTFKRLLPQSTTEFCMD